MSRPERVIYALFSFSMRKSRSTRRMGVIGISWNGDGLINTVRFVGVQRSFVPYKDTRVTITTQAREP